MHIPVHVNVCMCTLKDLLYVTSLFHTCDTTHTCVWHDPYMCVTWPINVCDTTGGGARVWWWAHIQGRVHVVFEAFSARQHSARILAAHKVCAKLLCSSVSTTLWHLRHDGLSVWLDSFVYVTRLLSAGQDSVRILAVHSVREKLTCISVSGTLFICVTWLFISVTRLFRTCDTTP